MSSSIRKSVNSDALTRLAQAIAVAVSATLAGCSSHAPQTEATHTPNIAARAKQKPIWLTEKPTPVAPQDIWERMRQGFQLQEGLGVNPRIEQQRLWFASNPSFSRMPANAAASTFITLSNASKSATCRWNWPCCQ